MRLPDPRKLLLLRLRFPSSATFGRLRLDVPVGVFHPTYFYSSRCFARWLQRQALAGKSVLDLGCGAGLLALTCAQAGARVTAVDINPDAVAATSRNARKNGLSVDCKQSNQFASVADQRFDLVVINPPYFRGEPSSMAGRAWHAGAGFEYFEALFSHLGVNLGGELGEVAMILAENCDIDAIASIAFRHGLRLSLQHQEAVIFEQQYIFTIRRSIA